jgi:hypothetical protein
MKVSKGLERDGLLQYAGHLMDGSARAPMKTVPSCDMLRGGARSLRSEDCRMGIPVPQGTFSKEKRNPGNRNILVPGGKEIN